MNELILPWPHKDLSPNARVHWRQKAQTTKNVRKAAMIMAMQADWSGASLPEGRLHLHVTFYPPTKRLPDDDNMLARFKPYRDGIADALGIDDKRFISHPLVSTEVRKGGQVVVRITGGPEA
jgi:crossover junction endodeoxyribonuclease RusA